MRSSGYPKRKKTKLCLIYSTMVIEINNFLDIINIIPKKPPHQYLFKKTMNIIRII